MINIALLKLNLSLFKNIYILKPNLLGDAWSVFFLLSSLVARIYLF